MEVNGQDININEIIEKVDIDKNIPLKRKNNIVLRDSWIEILKRNGINYETHTNLNSLLFEIEEILNEEDTNEELEWLAEELSEINYYYYTNK